MTIHPTPQATQTTRPFVKWAGGKSRLLNHIIPAIPAGRRFVEPFLGGGAVFLNAKNFDQYLLGDSNKHLIDLYTCVVEHRHEFIALASTFFDESYRSPERYQEVRHAFNHERDVMVRSARFVYLNRFGFNGLCRYNRAGQFNTPYGHPRQVPGFPVKQILAFAEKAQRATFVHGDFSELMRLATPGDVVYCDPPYLDRDDSASFRAYGADGFGVARQGELAELSRELAARGVPVVISNHDCRAARELYAGAEIITFPARRSISAATGSRGNVGELLAIFR
ncbi:Dam family site-specific DNA-(adenine-N6)-methyltransferase [Paraburkholderia sp. IMGN_8]|uniref:DNA adenine methylase n=1 Tax=Paraburkholderia sp. IMGN_8 TaxID=3136564 RepID=UPI0031011FB1